MSNAGGEIVFPNNDDDVKPIGFHSEDGESRDGEVDATEESNEAIALVKPQKRRYHSDDEGVQNVTPSPNSSFHASSFSLLTHSTPSSPTIKAIDAPIDTETLAQDVRLLLRQRGMRQTDLAPFMGCRPGSVAGVFAKANLPWSQLNEFNKNAFLAMSRWFENAKMEPVATTNVLPAVQPSMSPVPPMPIRIAVPDHVTTSSRSPLISPPQPLLRPWAVANCSKHPGYLLFLENMHVAVPSRGMLFQGANLSLAPGKRYGLVGPSECGASTLMKFIAAKDDLNIPAEVEIVYCDLSSANTAIDEPDMPDHQRPIDYVVQLEKRWSKLKAEEAILEPLVRQGDRDSFARLRLIYEQLCFLGSGAAEVKARQLLTGLGFSPESFEGALKDLSLRGRKVIALARALFAEPALLLLDRPTNLLDVESIAWLEAYFKNWPGCLLIATQDRCFMDAVCSAVIYVHSQKLFYYQGNYSRFKQQITQK